MFSNRRLSQKATRGAAVSLLASLALIIVNSPAQAATSISEIDSSAILLIIAFGTLLVAIVLEVLRMTLRGHAPFENPATHDWKPHKKLD